MELELIVLSALALVGSFALTALVRRYAIKASLLDVPNERSMHEHPTPRGGGLAIVVMFLIGGAWIASQGQVPKNLAIGLLPTGALVAAMGWYDDRHTLSNKVRMALWFPAAIWAVYWVGGLPSLDLGMTSLPLGIIGSALAVIGVVWLLNLYNFMDGTDGLAGSQAVLAAATAGALIWLGGNPGLAALIWLLAAASLGFLAWNWPPAKIFMGDVGSGFLGFTFAVLAIHSENTGALPLAVWGILLAVFIIDATLTVVRRLKNKERLSEPHRSHAYQAFAKMYSHRILLWAFIGVNAVLILAAIMARQGGPLLSIVLATVVIVGVIGWALAIKKIGMANR